MTQYDTGYPAEKFSRHFGIIVTVMLFFALSIRVCALFSLRNSLYADFLMYDERVYHDWALRILKGAGDSVVIWDFTPLPAYMMAAVYKIFSPDTLYIRILNIVSDVITCGLLCILGTRLADRTAGFFSGMIYSLYSPSVFFSITLMKTSLSLMLFAMSLCLFFALTDSPSLLGAFCLGISIGLLLNVRANCIPVIILLPFLFCRKHYTNSGIRTALATVALYLAGLSVAILPFAARNYRLSGNFSLTVAGGFNLYLGNNLKNPYPYYRPVSFASSSASKQAVQFVIEASRRVGKKLSVKEASDYWTEETVRLALDHPYDFSKKIALKTLALFNRYEAEDNYHIGFVSRFIPFFRFPFIGIWMLLPFAIAGIAVSIRRSDRLLHSGLILFFYAVTLIIFFVNMRLRLQLMILLIPFAIIGVREVISCRQPGKILRYLSVCLICVITEFLPLPGTDDLTAHYNSHAVNLKQKGSEEDALKYWKASSAMNGYYSAFADLSLAGIYFRKGDMNNARKYLDKIPDDSFAAARKAETEGDILMSTGQADKAIAAYEKSLEINSGQPTVIEKLIRICQKSDKQKAAQAEERLRYVRSFYEPPRMK